MEEGEKAKDPSIGCRKTTIQYSTGHRWLSFVSAGRVKAKDRRRKAGTPTVSMRVKLRLERPSKEKNRSFLLARNAKRFLTTQNDHRCFEIARAGQALSMSVAARDPTSSSSTFPLPARRKKRFATTRKGSGRLACIPSYKRQEMRGATRAVGRWSKQANPSSNLSVVPTPN